MVKASHSHVTMLLFVLSFLFQISFCETYTSEESTAILPSEICEDVPVYSAMNKTGNQTTGKDQEKRTATYVYYVTFYANT